MIILYDILMRNHNTTFYDIPIRIRFIVYYTFVGGQIILFPSGYKIDILLSANAPSNFHISRLFHPHLRLIHILYIHAYNTSNHSPCLAQSKDIFAPSSPGADETGHGGDWRTCGPRVKKGLVASEQSNSNGPVFTKKTPRTPAKRKNCSSLSTTKSSWKLPHARIEGGATNGRPPSGFSTPKRCTGGRGVAEALGGDRLERVGALAVEKINRTPKLYPTKPSTYTHTTTTMQRSNTPDSESHDMQKHYLTPTKAKVQGAIEFCEAMNLPHYKEDVFRVLNVKRRQGYDFLRNESSSRRLHNDLIATRFAVVNRSFLQDKFEKWSAF